MAPFMHNGSEAEESSSSTTTLASAKSQSQSQPPTLTSLLSSLHADLLSQAHRIPADLRTLREISQTGLNGGLIDDRKYLVRLLQCTRDKFGNANFVFCKIENIIQVAASLPNTSGLRNKLTDTFVSTLWNNLQHPPLSYLGDEFRYRRADGSFNVLHLLPFLIMAPISFL